MQYLCAMPQSRDLVDIVQYIAPKFGQFNVTMQQPYLVSLFLLLHLVTISRFPLTGLQKFETFSDKFSRHFRRFKALFSSSFLQKTPMGGRVTGSHVQRHGKEGPNLLEQKSKFICCIVEIS